MKIAFVTPQLGEKFSGGMLCVLKYAHGLADRGHEVYVVPTLPGAHPAWAVGGAKILSQSSGRLALDSFMNLLRVPKYIGSAVELKSSVRSSVGKFALALAAYFPEELRSALYPIQVGSVLPPVDVVVATSFGTALPVWLSSAPNKWYFAQHYEPYFSDEYSNAKLAQKHAVWSYELGLRMMVNSSWLQTKLRQDHGLSSHLVPNAIDHSVFFPSSHQTTTMGHSIRVISYGGRNAEWKGFKDMAMAMRIVRQALPSVAIEWLVYGDSVLPPNNDVCAYQPLGFLNQQRLADAYRTADILLSASWYESFPLFPLEAMACGCAVVTTQLGTEDYAQHGITAEIVSARDPESIAWGLRRLVEDKVYRQWLAGNAVRRSYEFDWDRSVNRMESVLVCASED